MDDSIDYRRIRKQSKSLLKWGTGLNKTMRNTMKTGSLQSIYDSSQSTGEESRLSSGIYSTNSKGGALIRQSSVPDLKVIRTETTPDVPLSPNQSFHRKCQHTFKMYSKHPTSVSSTDRHQVVGIPYSDIDDAIEALEEILELPIKHLVAKDKYFHKGGVQTIVEYSSFYLYACKLFDRKPETAITHSPNSIKINDSSKERQHSSAAINAPTLVRRDRSLVSPNELLTQDGFAIPITDPNASVVTLKGTVIPSTYLKDAIVDSYRRHNTSQSVENWNTTSRAKSRFFSDESTSSCSDDRTASESALHSLRKDIDSKQVFKIMNQKEDELHKWRQMRSKRDARLDRIEAQRGRNEMVQSFKRISINADKNDFYDVYQAQSMELSGGLKKNHDSIVQQQLCVKKRLSKERERDLKKKRIEIRYMKKVLNDSISHSRILFEDEHIMMKMDRDSDIFNEHVASYPSSLVRIPISLKDRLKNAKSLREFNDAKSGIKEYYENTMSDRITAYSKNRSLALDNASEASIESFMHKSPILGSQYFEEYSDTQSTLSQSQSHSDLTSHLSVGKYKLDPPVVDRYSQLLPAISGSIVANRSGLLSRGTYESAEKVISSIESSLHYGQMRPSTKDIALMAYLEQVQRYREDSPQHFLESDKLLDHRAKLESDKLEIDSLEISLGSA